MNGGMPSGMRFGPLMALKRLIESLIARVTRAPSSAKLLGDVDPVMGPSCWRHQWQHLDRVDDYGRGSKLFERAHRARGTHTLPLPLAHGSRIETCSP